MSYPQLTGEPNFILIGVTAVFGLLVIIIVYYIVISKSPNKSILYTNNNDTNNNYTNNNDTNNNDTNNNYTNNNNMQILNTSQQNSLPLKALPFPVNSKTNGNYAPASLDNQTSLQTTPQSAQQNLSSKNKQVFNIKENIYTMDDAGGVCGALGAEIASIDQLINAHKQGADWCNVGWTKDGLAAYPIQYSTWKTLQDNEPQKRNMCGTPGINLVRNDPNLLYGVNCYGIKPEPKQGEKVKQIIQSDAHLALQEKIAQFQKNINKIGVAPHNQDAWSSN